MYFAIAYYSDGSSSPVVIITKEADAVFEFMEAHKTEEITIYKADTHNVDGYFELLVGRELIA